MLSNEITEALTWPPPITPHKHSNASEDFLTIWSPVVRRSQ